MKMQAKNNPSVSLSRIILLFRPHAGRLGAVLSLVVLSAMVAMLPPFLLRAILDTAIPQGRTGLLSCLALTMITLTMASTTIGVLQAYFSMAVGQLVMNDLRTSVYAHMQRMSLAFFTRSHSGEVQSRIGNDISGIDVVVTSMATGMVGNAAAAVASLTAMVALDWRLSLASITLLPLFVWVNRKVGSERRALVQERQQQMAVLSTLVEESLSISGFMLGRLLGRSRELTDRFSNESRILSEISIKTTMAGRWRQAGLQVVVTAMPIIIYWVAGLVTAGRPNTISVGTVVAFAALQQSLLNPSVQLIQIGSVVQSSMAIFQRIFEYLDLTVDVPEPAEPVALVSARGHIRFENVSFSYGKDPVLCGLSIDVPQGSSVALVGATGAGKSSVGYLLLRLYDVSSGRITIDGVDVRHMTFETISRVVGMVSQETHMFNASVSENLRFGKPDATDEELFRVARLAHIHDFIVALPDGYKTVVGERGYRFSGGEKQRLAIARTMLRNPRVLLLDEATSALDTKTERAVQQALEELTRNRTTITIAHRLSTIENVDRIIVLDKGRIIEQGTHAELLERAGEYAELVAAAARSGSPREGDPSRVS